MAKKKQARKSAPTKKTTALVPTGAAAEPEAPLALIARVAKDKTVDVEKLGKLIELQRSMMATQAKIDFDQAFAAMTPNLPTITKRGKIQGKNRAAIPYARLGEDIHPVIKPILTRHGFAIRHRTEWPRPDCVRVVGVLTHLSGHSEESAFEAPADKSDYRTHVQSLGSSVSYGRRYTTIDLLNLTVLGADDDGSKGQKEPPEPPPPAEAHNVGEMTGRTPGAAATVPGEQRATHGAEGEVITQPQRQRLALIINNSDRTDVEVVEWLRKAYGLQGEKPTKSIVRRDYDGICRAIEAKGPLPQGRAT
jgi:hypothetical protein